LGPIHIIKFLIHSAIFASTWPVAQNITGFNTINCTFGEIHGGGDAIHNGTDIARAEGCTVHSIENGRIIGMTL
jgi:murein DD-endopeptidase MepM/ murein hydrolase activator NlpD